MPSATLQDVAYRLQVDIAINPGYAAWRHAWSDTATRWTGPEALHVIAGPLIARLDRIDTANAALQLARPPRDIADQLTRLNAASEPLLRLRPLWVAALESRLDPNLTHVERREALAMDLDFGGVHLADWEHEEPAVSAALALAPVLDDTYRALVPLTGHDVLGTHAP